MYVLIRMNVFGSFSLWEPTCVCCVASGAGNTHIFVWKCLCATLNFHSFIMTGGTHAYLMPHKVTSRLL